MSRSSGRELVGVIAFAAHPSRIEASLGQCDSPTVVVHRKTVNACVRGLLQGLCSVAGHPPSAGNWLLPASQMRAPGTRILQARIILLFDGASVAYAARCACRVGCGRLILRELPALLGPSVCTIPLFSR